MKLILPYIVVSRFYLPLKLILYLHFLLFFRKVIDHKMGKADLHFVYAVPQITQTI